MGLRVRGERGDRKMRGGGVRQGPVDDWWTEEGCTMMGRRCIRKRGGGGEIWSQVGDTWKKKKVTDRTIWRYRKVKVETDAGG